MKVEVVYSNCERLEHMAPIWLKCEKGSKEERVLLNIDYKNLFAFTHIKDGPLFDLFLFGSVVYGTDILLSRSDSEISTNHWTREIELSIPVADPNFWSSHKSLINKMLSFLTGDLWSINFLKRDDKIILYRGNRKVYKDIFRNSFNVVNLFSGGLDSLVGAIDAISHESNKVVLVSHYDAVFKGAKTDQDNIIRIFSECHKNFHQIQTRVDLSPYDIYGGRVVRETTLRSRSFMFLSQGVLVAHSIASDMPVHIPENGTISLNHPLTPSRQSSCSTRTTHPYFIKLFNEFLNSMGINNMVANPYGFLTKGEILEQCDDLSLLKSTFKLSCSCGKRGTRKDIRDITSGTSHCGVCMPCIYRRVALFKLGWDDEIIGTDIFRSKKRNLNNIPDMPALMVFIKSANDLETIKRNLMINGTLPDIDSDADKYADVVKRTRNDIIEWIRTKGSKDAREYFGV